MVFNEIYRSEESPDLFLYCGASQF
jgi:hypothetical protein